MQRNMKKKVITKQKETIFKKNAADSKIQVASYLKAPSQLIQFASNNTLNKHAEYYKSEILRVTLIVT